MCAAGHGWQLVPETACGAARLPWACHVCSGLSEPLGHSRPGMCCAQVVVDGSTPQSIFDTLRSKLKDFVESNPQARPPFRCCNFSGSFAPV